MQVVTVEKSHKKYGGTGFHRTALTCVFCFRVFFVAFCIFMRIQIDADFLHFAGIHIIEEESDFVIPYNRLPQYKQAGKLFFIDIGL